MIFKKTATQKIADYCGKSKTDYIKVEHYKPNRTLEQNALFHKWCEIISADSGHTPDEVKFIIKFKFLGLVDYEILGNFHQKARPTRDLNTEEFRILLNNIQSFFLDFNIPLPNRETLLYG